MRSGLRDASSAGVGERTAGRWTRAFAEAAPRAQVRGLHRTRGAPVDLGVSVALLMSRRAA